MKEELIKVVICEVDKEARVTTIKNDLKTLQDFVGGYIEVLNIDDGIDLVCNEEGKIPPLPANRGVKNQDGQIVEVICGNFLFVSTDSDGEFISLTDEQILHVMKHYRFPEEFFIDNDNKLCVKIKVVE